MRDVEIARISITVICPECYKRVRIEDPSTRNPMRGTCWNCGEWLTVEVETGVEEKP